MLIKRPRIRPWMLRKEIIILFYGLRDKRTGMGAKLSAIASIVYLLSPIDLIPDFIPFFGYVDDIIIVPLFLNLAIRLLPAVVREESIIKASRNKARFQLLIIMVIILITGLVICLFFLIRHLIHKI